MGKRYVLEGNRVIVIGGQALDLPIDIEDLKSVIIWRNPWYLTKEGDLFTFEGESKGEF